MSAPEDGGQAAAIGLPVAVPALRCDAEAWKMRNNEEPRLGDVRADPIILAVMRRDAVSQADLDRLITEARGRLFAEDAGELRRLPNPSSQSASLQRVQREAARAHDASCAFKINLAIPIGVGTRRRFSS
jgi:hypothetical protein